MSPLFNQKRIIRIQSFDFVNYPTGLVEPSGEINGGEKGFEGIRPHLDLDVFDPVLDLGVAHPEHAVYVHSVFQDLLGQPLVLHVLYLEVRHAPFRQRRAGVDVLAHDELQDGVAEELQPLIGLGILPLVGGLFGETVMRQGGAEDAEVLLGDIPVGERGLREEDADVHAELPLAIGGIFETHAGNR